MVGRCVELHEIGGPEGYPTLHKAKVLRVYKTPKSHPFFPQVSISSLLSAASRRRSSNFRSISTSLTRSFFIHPE
ncbi:hypothetical protein L1987_28482 [Smallanthus sonchifolius]|uniref:Uncharacterized protein n=1 Tax=Smallanthus sonchifolius TaxID=185202 RepID=A0ACB9HX36_9ASTR|nr:hypothetical protein L1987_28482 [Smallanthus sonchifolius]